MFKHTPNLIVGQGLAGSAIAWTLHWTGQQLTVVDAGDPDSASRVAAGLITPVTGKRLVQSPDYHEAWSAAVKFYRRVERDTGCSLFEERPMLRLFADAETRDAFLQRSDPVAAQQVVAWEGRLQNKGSLQTGVVLHNAGRLNVVAYLQATRQFFEAQGCYLAADVDLNSITCDASSRIQLPDLKLTANRMVVCHGATRNVLFPDVPNNPARGDILTVRIPDYHCQQVAHRSVWIAPNDDGTQTAGATYDWQYPVAEVSEAGRLEILYKLQRMVAGEVEVYQQRAGVRPTMKDYQPVIGPHPNRSGVFVLNGLGSKGTLKAPLLAEQLQRFMDQQVPLPPAHSYARLLKTTSGGLGAMSLTTRAQQAVGEVLKVGGTAVDATVGNGFDTCFLSETVGPSGQVIGFDVQQLALDATLKRLQARQLCNVRLLHQGHQTMSSVTWQKRPDAIMFNLGFLPRSDHQVVTEPESSVAAIQQAVELLQDGGILTVLAYRGHAGGPEEFAAVEQVLQQCAETYQLQRFDSSAPKSTSPVLFILKKTHTL